MAVITESIEINRPAKDVEQTYTDWTQYPNFIPFIEDVQMLGDDTFECQLRIAGMTFGYTADVKKLKEMEYSWETTRGDLVHKGKAIIESLDAKRSRLTLTVDYHIPGPVLAGRISNWLGLANTGIRSSLENFRAYSESL
mgnify:CR=1 FL=1